MKILFVCILVLSFKVSKAEVPIILNNRDGIYVSYELTKLDGNEKKDKYLCMLKAENKNNYDVFYAVPLSKAADGTEGISLIENKGFSQVTVRNATGLFGSNQSLKGQETKLQTNDKNVLFTIGKGEFITAELEFNVKIGEKPIITNTFLKPFKESGFFDIALDEATVNGEWISNCGSIQMTLYLTKNATGEIGIQQTVNGKQNMWVKNNVNSFEKINDKSATLNYTKSNKTFNYTTNDGVACIWTKK